jgi:5-methylcytosine-specific restriction endonuclease McrA
MLKIIEKTKILTGYNPSGKPTYRTGYKCKCPVCDKVLIVSKIGRVKSQKSCKECRPKLNTKHGHSNKPYYFVWQAMKDRCYNPNNKKYKMYGGSGITVCSKWQTFRGFWQDNKKLYKKGLTIDRIDSSKNYEPNNVQWISHSENSAKTNRRKPIKRTLEGIKEQFSSIREAHRETGVPLRTIENRLRTGTPGRDGYIWEYC